MQLGSKWQAVWLRPSLQFAPLSCRLSLLLPFSLSKHVSSCCRPAGGVSSAALWLAALGLWALFQPSPIWQQLLCRDKMEKMQTFLDEEMRDRLQENHARFRLVSDSDCVDQLAANTMYDQKKDVYPGEPAGQPHWHVLQPCHSESAHLAS